MREIKFRAWYKHKHNNDNGWIEYLKMGVDTTYQCRFLLSKNMPHLLSLVNFGLLDEFKFETDFALMQYTGLKDKNGKEIYEGDIILYPTTYTEKVDVGVGSIPVAQWQENGIAEVMYKVGSFGIDIKLSDETFWEERFYTFREMTEDYVEVKEMEVIGNIYENPELLTV